MIVQWNGEDLELAESYRGSWVCRSLRGGNGSLSLGQVDHDGSWFAFLRFSGRRVSLESFDCDTAQEAVDQVHDQVAGMYFELGVALHGMERGGPETLCAALSAHDKREKEEGKGSKTARAATAARIVREREGAEILDLTDAFEEDSP